MNFDKETCGDLWWGEGPPLLTGSHCSQLSQLKSPQMLDPGLTICPSCFSRKYKHMNFKVKFPDLKMLSDLNKLFLKVILFVKLAMCSLSLKIRRIWGFWTKKGTPGQWHFMKVSYLFCNLIHFMYLLSPICCICAC